MNLPNARKSVTVSGFTGAHAATVPPRSSSHHLRALCPVTSPYRLTYAARSLLASFTASAATTTIRSKIMRTNSADAHSGAFVAKTRNPTPSATGEETTPEVMRYASATHSHAT